MAERIVDKEVLLENCGQPRSLFFASAITSDYYKGC